VKVVPQAPIVHSPVGVTNDVACVPEDLKIYVTVLRAKLLAVLAPDEPISCLANLFYHFRHRIVRLLIMQKRIAVDPFKELAD